MNAAYRVFLAALACAANLVIALEAIADSPTAAPSQEEIGLQLKTRGLPNPGTAPAPPPGPIPGAVPANMQSVLPPPESPRSTIGRAVSQPPAAPEAPPSISFTTITFQFGSTQLRPESIETLRNLGNALNQQLKDEKAFVVEGHTDKTGAPVYNDELSRRRADAVKDYLVNVMGVSPYRLQSVGKGSSELADPKHPYAAGNRRVRVLNTGPS